MLSIFEQKDFEQPPERKLTLNRLQTVLGPAPAKPEGPRPGIGLEEPLPPQAAAAPAVALERRPPQPPRAAPEEPPPASVAPAVPAELQHSTDEFARSFRELLVTTVRELQAPMLAEIGQKIELLARSLQELTARVEKLEDTANIVGAAAHALQDAQQATEKRLELQAGVLRGLNSVVNAREDRLDKLLSTFQALQGGAGEHPGRRSLPENL